MLSPLRYPGGKAKLLPFFSELFRENELYGVTYAEPYAGGAGLALKLLAHGYVSRVELNDIDPAITAFWRSVTSNADQFCALISDSPVSVTEWHRQRDIYNSEKAVDDLTLGYATYYLNRTSRSGIIEGSGPIGGYEQKGLWKIDARFNKSAQIGQIQEIKRFASQISISQQDAVEFAKARVNQKDSFMYLDPPYYVKGKKLYKNFYRHDDHAGIAEMLAASRDGRWVLSYDHVPDIIELYPSFDPVVYNLQYSAGSSMQGTEVIFLSDRLSLPKFDGFKRAV